MRQLVNKYSVMPCRNTFRNALLMLVACCLLLPEAVAQNANRKIKVTGTVFDERRLAHDWSNHQGSHSTCRHLDRP
ncbi:MAG: hypothetical protein ACLVL2_11820 [Bacteroides cellulosilyticus]